MLPAFATVLVPKETDVPEMGTGTILAELESFASLYMKIVTLPSGSYTKALDPKLVPDIVAAVPTSTLLPFMVNTLAVAILLFPPSLYATKNFCAVES